MGGRTKILRVDYYAQPTGTTCQSTCLKMMTSYLEGGGVFGGGGSGQAATLNPVDIYKTINEDSSRPDTKYTNSHKNMMWWLQNHFPNLKFKEVFYKDATQAAESIVSSIDRDSPVMVGVSHARVEGHIILVIGYVNYYPLQCGPDSGFVVHDPYGKFDPTLLSSLYGAQRFSGGASLMMGGEIGPGRAVVVPIQSLSRQRSGDSVFGMFSLISVDR